MLLEVSHVKFELRIFNSICLAIQWLVWSLLTDNKLQVKVNRSTYTILKVMMIIVMGCGLTWKCPSVRIINNPLAKYHNIPAQFPSGRIPLYLSHGIALPTTLRGAKLLYTARRLEEHKQIPVLLYLSTVPIMIRKEIWSNTFDPLMSLYIDSHHINRCKPVSMMGLLSLFLLSMNANWIAHNGLKRPSQSWVVTFIAPSAAVSRFFHWFSW